MNELADPKEERLYQRVTDILGDAHRRVARTVNTEMVNAYWRIGREIVEVEQSGNDRANYGAAVMTRLAARLRLGGSRGLSHTNLKQMRQFFLAFPEGSVAHKLLKSQKNIGQTVSDQSATTRFHPSLGWTHYCALMRVLNPEARSFYEIEAARESWSVRQLERQIESMLFERLALKGDSAKLANEGQKISQPRDVLKDPFVLEFLGVAERTSTKERELEQLIIERLEEFLLELGKGFCFVGRQKRVTLEGDHFYVDLVFYNRILRSFVLVDLKLGKLTHQDLGQMQMYVNFFDRFQRLEGEAQTIGIVLCSEKNEAMVRITLPEDNEQILTARYQQCLPTEAELRERLNRDREDAERALLYDKEDPR
ncbi:MAG: PDDEXK nuclease domain-containing protein [Archangium sp.]|nr:PDDEXK nuclease domain-containing protein [Archangium sp.]MDP3575638.1 PDDEXK nuclease domain-containing protein [Archangium sp.]